MIHLEISIAKGGLAQVTFLGTGIAMLTYYAVSTTPPAAAPSTHLAPASHAGGSRSS